MGDRGGGGGGGFLEGREEGWGEACFACAGLAEDYNGLGLGGCVGGGLVVVVYVREEFVGEYLVGED